MDGQTTAPEPLRRVAVRIAYRGQEFHGSQRQPGTRTVEGEIIEALLQVQEGMTEEELELKAASRTDAGVSALGNVVSFRTRFRDDALLMDALNAVCRGVFFLAVADLPEGYGIRRALRRRYLYVHPAARLNIERMREAAAMMRGEHDFARFCRDDGKPTLLLMEEVDIQIRDGLLEVYFTAPYFLWNLVRRLMAALIKVGRGRATLDDVRRALDGEDILFGLARPDRLTLLDVEYDDLHFRYFHGVPLRRHLEEERLQALLSLEFHSRLLP